MNLLIPSALPQCQTLRSVSPVGFRFAHACITAQVRALADDAQGKLTVILLKYYVKRILFAGCLTVSGKSLFLETVLRLIRGLTLVLGLGHRGLTPSVTYFYGGSIMAI